MGIPLFKGRKHLKLTTEILSTSGVTKSILHEIDVKFIDFPSKILPRHIL